MSIWTTSVAPLGAATCFLRNALLITQKTDLTEWSFSSIISAITFARSSEVVGGREDDISSLLRSSWEQWSCLASFNGGELGRLWSEEFRCLVIRRMN